jgi:hypothetical protein
VSFQSCSNPLSTSKWSHSYLVDFAASSNCCGPQHVFCSGRNINATLATFAAGLVVCKWMPELFTSSTDALSSSGRLLLLYRIVVNSSC